MPWGERHGRGAGAPHLGNAHEDKLDHKELGEGLLAHVVACARGICVMADAARVGEKPTSGGVFMRTEVGGVAAGDGPLRGIDPVAVAEELDGEHARHGEHSPAAGEGEEQAWSAAVRPALVSAAACPAEIRRGRSTTSQNSPVNDLVLLLRWRGRRDQNTPG